jgi:WD40 repeat protein
MLRRILYSGIALGAIAGLCVWAGGKPAAVAQEARPSQNTKVPAEADTQAGREKASPQPLTAQAASTVSLPSLRTAEPRLTGSDPIVLPPGQLGLIEVEDVPSQRDGVLMFIGTEIREGESVPPHDVLEVKLGDQKKRFRRLKEGDAVQENQLVALVDDTLARADEAIKKAKVKSAEADQVASLKTREEAKSRYQTQEKLYYSTQAGIRATSKEDLTGALLTWNKYIYETISKEEAIKVAEQELVQAQKTLAMYEIRPKISGVVRNILKHPGEAVKSLEPVMRIQSYDLLRVDALVPVQYANHLQKGMQVAIEPTFRESPKQTLIGHRGLVTSIAVCPDPRRPLIVSGSDDHTVRTWEASPGNGRMRPTHVLRHPAGVRAVACSATHCLSGDDQGKGRLWDLAHLDQPPLELKGQHYRSIECAAFSPDGKLCATGGGDNQIMVWDVATGNLRYRLSGHNSFVTALHFTPDSRLISVGRDPAVRFWKLGPDHAEALESETISRGRKPFDNLDVSSDSQRMMDEEGGEMRIISLRDGTTEAVLRNNSISTGRDFVNFALFSPDGRLALTMPSTGEFVQLWHIDKVRSYELREFICSVHGRPKSAAFAPDGSFVIAAVNDRIDLWQMPGKGDLGQRITGTITNVDKPIEDVRTEVKVTAELHNPDQRLRPGDVVTMVVYPQ